MTENSMVKLAEEAGFHAALLRPEEIPVNSDFRAYCEENLCGYYGSNYSCPPACGEPEDMRQALLAEEQVLVVETIWEIEHYADKPAIAHARNTHNAAVLRLMDRLRSLGYHGFCAGYNGCSLCSPCRCQQGLPCSNPNRRISCLSAYCVDAAQLAQQCGLEFKWQEGRLYLLGILAVHFTPHAGRSSPQSEE